MISKAYVFIDGLDEKPVICGVVIQKNNAAIFRYGSSYLSREDAFPLNPVSLPLTDEEFVVTGNDKIHGVLSDAGPDSWGEKIILTLHTTHPQNKIELLLAGANMGVGALMFSGSKKASKRKRSRNTLDDIDTLLQDAEEVLNNPNVSNEVKRAYEEGSFLGGARPKTLLRHNGKSYLVKFNAKSDLFNHARVEHASMNMLADLGCQVAHTQCLERKGGDILLVERFDLSESGLPACHYISANSLLGISSVKADGSDPAYSYGALAEILREQSDNPVDAQELFKRMVFNVLIGNTDDHARNHACLYHLKRRQWSLSPAYDVLPVSGKLHSMSIGKSGRTASFDNILSDIERFGIQKLKAKKIVKEVANTVSRWPQYFKDKGVSDGDIERLKGIIPKLPVKVRGY